MQFINLLKKYVINSQIFVSLMGTSLAFFFMNEQNAFRFPTLLLIFITFFSGYLYTKYQFDKKRLFKIIIINAFCGFISFLLIIKNHNEIRLVKWLVIVSLGLLYNSFFLSTYIRKIPLLKIFYVGLVWALVTSWLQLPIFNFPIFSMTFLYISALILPFDIRDFKTDEVVTFPKIIGIQNTKYIAYFLTFSACLIGIFHLEIIYSISFFLACIVTFILIYFSEENRTDVYYSFWVEMCCGLPLLFLVLLK